jgi:hypothetical protein
MAGRLSSGSQGVPIPSSNVWKADGRLDIARTMDGVPALCEIGVTDFSCPLYARSTDQSETEAALSAIVDAFRTATGRR